MAAAGCVRAFALNVGCEDSFTEEPTIDQEDQSEAFIRTSCSGHDRPETILRQPDRQPAGIQIVYRQFFFGISPSSLSDFAVRDRSFLAPKSVMFCCRMVLFVAVITLLTAGAPTFTHVSAAKSSAYTFSAKIAQEASFKNRDSKAVALEEILAASNSNAPKKITGEDINLGGKAQTRPCCVSSGLQRVDCFVKGPTAEVQWIYVHHGDYSDWVTLEGTIHGDIECVSRNDGVIDVLALDETGMLMDKTYIHHTWSEWKIVGGPYMEVPSCAARMAWIIDCMGRMANDASLQHIGHGFDGSWRYHDDFPGEWASSPVVCSRRSLVDFDCFGSGESMLLHGKFWISGEWSPWTSLSARGHKRPSIATWGTSLRMHLFAMAVETTGIVHIPINVKAEEPWEDLGGVFDSVPECVAYGHDLVYCFAVGEESYLYFNSLDLDGWSGWSRSTSFQFLETPSCVLERKEFVFEQYYIVCTGRAVGQDVIQITYDISVE